MLGVLSSMELVIVFAFPMLRFLLIYWAGRFSPSLCRKQRFATGVSFIRAI